MGSGSSKLRQLKDKLNKEKFGKDVFTKDVFNKDVFSRDRFHFSRRSEDGGSHSRKNSIKDTTTDPEPPIPDFPQPGMTRVDYSKPAPSLPNTTGPDTTKPQPPVSSSTIASQPAWPKPPQTEPIAQGGWTSSSPSNGATSLAAENWPQPPKTVSLAQSDWPAPPTHGRVPSQPKNEPVQEEAEYKTSQIPPRLSLAKPGSGFFDLGSDWLEQQRAGTGQLETVEEPADDSERTSQQPAQEASGGVSKDTSRAIKGEASQESPTTDQTTRPTGFRPPTPEYQKEDVKTAIVERLTSPVSPAASPEPPRNDAATEPSSKGSGEALNSMAKDQSTPEVKSESQDHRPMQGTPGPILQAPQPVPAPGGRAPRRMSLDMRSRAGTPPLTEPFPNYAASGRNSPGPDMMRGRQPEGYFRPASRNASMRPDSRSGSTHPDSRRRLDSMRSTAPEPDRLVRSSSGELLYRGRDGTLYPEMKELREPDPKASYFPLHNSEPPTEGTIFQAVPLRDTHYRCYQSHKSMLRRNNKHYPLACQTCQKSDMDDRWACTFCSLRICESCVALLETNKKDLSSVMRSLAAQ